MTLLVLGIGQWAGENEAETIFVVDIDSSGQVVSVTGFAPSLEVDVAGLEALGITRSRLKMVYHHGLELPGADEVSAASLTAQALVDNFNITPDQYIVVQEDYLASMIDTLGGIDVSLLATFGDMPPGYHHLDGETTWRYVGYIPQPGIPEEVPRIERQKLVLKALRDKLLSASILPKIPELLAGFVVEQGIKTDLSAQQILYLVGVLENTSLDEISFTVIPGTLTTGQADQPVTLLVLGIGQWAGENEAETIFVVDIESSGQVVSVTGFAPSLEVDVAGLEAMGITRSRLKMVYHHGLELPGADEISAAKLLAGALVDNFNITPDQYIVVQEDYLASMIDTLGGMDASPLVAFGAVPPGDQQLDGETTWRYVGYIPQPGIPEEVPRIERHVPVLEALRGELLSASTLPKIPDLLAGFVVEDGVKTDLSAQQILYLMGVLGDTSLDEISFTVIPGS
jgi:anionic cell wall polymer biosynthesis LytR-Cps2A-Psr (LCP) family protein